MNTNDIARKRAILLTAKLRFSPHTQPVKETALDKIIEQILSVVDAGRSLSLEEIQDILSYESGSYAIAISDIKNSLERLEAQDRVFLNKQGDLELYRLSEIARFDVEDAKRQADLRFNSVVNRLFKNAKEGPSAYYAPFLEFLCNIFASLGMEYVRVMKGDVKSGEFTTMLTFFSSFEKIKNEYDSIDHCLFRDAVAAFFEDSNPDYDSIKWNMVQNYFVTKALGLDPQGSILSEELFKNAVFYLDTNVLISALEPKGIHYKTFLVFCKGSKQLGIKLKTCQISLDEYRDWLNYQLGLIEKVKSQIPDETAPTIRSPVFQAYLEKTKSGESVDLDELFRDFYSRMENLRNRFEVEVEDNNWFKMVSSKAEIASFSEALRAKYVGMKGRVKKEKAALHDAILLFWIQKLRGETSGSIELITLDTTLPYCIPPAQDTHRHSAAITLDAVLQWISPVTVGGSEEDDFPTIFGRMIASRFLPLERVFELEDFLIFSEIGMSCKELPAADVEECIRYIGTHAASLDPTDPVDREKLAYKIAKFFTSPERKFRQELESLQAGNAHRDKMIEKLGMALLRRSAWLRVGLMALVLLMIEALVVYLADQYGEGSNLFIKVLNSWPFLGIGPAISYLFGWIILGKKRIEVLGPPFTKVFRLK